ncbi:MAG: GNAT family N-acetyltransferase [Dehalococcoidia bacterium]|nr:GNAT family N-acetyltransferase [Dehalococcoidia bacterium]
MELLRDLETERLLLRLHTIDDLEEIHRLLYADPEVAPPFASKVYTLEETRERLSEKIWLNQHSGGQGWGYWTVIRREDHQLMGLVIFGHPERVYWNVDWPDLYKESPFVPLFTEIGYAFGRAYWGQGYATEAASVVLEYAFRELRVNRFEIPWYKGPRNPRSFNVYRRLGFDVKDGVDVRNHDVLLTLDNRIPDLPTLATSPTPVEDDSFVAGSSQMELGQFNNLKSPDPIVTERLLLRGIKSDDIEDISSRTNQNPYHRKYFGRVHSFEVFHGILRFAQASPLGARIRHAYAYDGLGSWAVVQKADGSLLGHISLGPAARTYWTVFPEDANSPYVRWEVDLVCVLDEQCWGRGYEREASEAMIEYAFRKMKLARIVNNVDADDTRSNSLFKSLGFTIERNLHPRYGGFVATLANDLLL